MWMERNELRRQSRERRCKKQDQSTGDSRTEACFLLTAIGSLWRGDMTGCPFLKIALAACMEGHWGQSGSRRPSETLVVHTKLANVWAFLRREQINRLFWSWHLLSRVSMNVQ